MKIEKIFIATHKRDVRLSRICVASIRYFYPTVPIYLIKDYYSGEFSTEEIERVWNVRRYETPHRCFGWGMSKLEPVFSESGTRLLILDSDTVFTGRVLDRLEEFSEDFVVHLETQPPQRVREIYFDLDRLREFDSDFIFAGQTFNTGQYVATGGLLQREDFGAVDWTNTPPSLGYPKTFKNGEQGVLNYVLLKKACLGQVSLAGVPFMKWPQDGIADIDLTKLAADSPYPNVIHWAGLTRPRLQAMIRSDILLFFEDYYYSRIPFGKTKSRYRLTADLLARISAKVVRRARSVQAGFTKNGRSEVSPEARRNVSVANNAIHPNGQSDASTTKSGMVAKEDLRSIYRGFVPIFLRRLLQPITHPRLTALRLHTRYHSAGTVVSGPFAGMKHNHKYLDLPKILGTYEIELHEIFCRLRDRDYLKVVDIGAAEGYYAVGVALWNPRCSVTAYEANPAYHESIRYLAKVNNVESRLELQGSCNEDSLNNLGDELRNAFVIVDVEGYEKTLLDPKTVPALQTATILVEVHDCFVEGCTDAIIQRFHDSHKISSYESRVRKVTEYPVKSIFTQFKFMHPAVINAISDGRTEPNGWLLLEPK